MWNHTIENLSKTLQESSRKKKKKGGNKYSLTLITDTKNQKAQRCPDRAPVAISTSRLGII